MRPDLPTGVVTLLFTDIEGSTRLLAEQRRDYIETLAEHRRVVRAAAHDHHGVEVDAHGDSFMLAFARPSDAVATAREAQLALADGPVRVRMGIHTGEPELTDEGYVGLDVHRAARIADAGHGGQVLISSTTVALVDLPMVDLGLHRLRGLEDPESLFQLRLGEAAESFPPLRTAEADRPHLPERSTSFVGREAELERIASLLDDPKARLVTLVGPGGCGKTRLAIEATDACWGRRRQRAVFIPLAAITEPGLLIPSLAEHVGLHIDLGHSPRSPEEQLVDYLQPRSLLLGLDNLEQLLPDATPLLARMLEGAPDTTLLVTSRTRTGLQGEWVVDIGGLGLRDDGVGDEPGAGIAPDDAAIRLFLERARQRDPRLTVSDDMCADVGRICRFVEGMPLGIELAAAWTGTLSIHELAEELEQSLDLLTSQAADLPERHRSLRAAFDGSVRLLDDEQRRALLALSVFRTPFTRDAASEVGGTPVTVLAELVARSLIKRTSGDRFEIHALIHQFATEMLEAGGSAEGVRETHARYFAEMVTSREGRLRSTDTLAATAELRPCVADIRAATTWAAVRWDVEQVRPILRTLTLMWSARLDPGGVEFFRGLAELTGVTEEALRQAQPRLMGALVAAHFAMSLASVDADKAESDAVASACCGELRNAGLRVETAACLLAMGINCVNRDQNHEAIPLLAEADDLLKQERDDLLRTNCLTWLGWARLISGDTEGARRDYAAAHGLALECGDPVVLGFTTSKLGTLADAEGRHDEALALHLDAFANFDAAGNAGGVGYSLSRASLSAWSLGDHQPALDFASTAYERFSDVGHDWGRTIAAARMTYAYLGLGRLTEAREWGLTSLRLARSDLRLGRLYALSSIAATMIRAGDDRTGLPILRAVLADEDFSPIFATQARAELSAAETHLSAPRQNEGAETLDLDALVDGLLTETPSAP